MESTVEYSGGVMRGAAIASAILHPKRPMMAMDKKPAGKPDRLAFDKSTRHVDVDGRLHVALNHISKANVCPYRGSEIPDFEALGLDPNKIYQLFRHPDELAKAASTFNNLPLLSRHVPVTVDEPQPDLVIGSTGTDAVFNAPYLDNSLVVWDAGAIAGIDTEQQKELSPAYRYIADMTPGEYQGLTFDGIMRDIKGNHVALVEAGRTGSDVVVGDSALTSIASRGFKGIKGGMKLYSRKALMASGAIAALVAPKLAQDAKVDFTDALKGVNAKNFGAKKAGILAALTKITKGKLAQDAELDDVIELLDSLGEMDIDGSVDDAIVDPQVTAVDDDGDMVSKIMAFLKGKISDDDMNALTAMTKPEGAADEPPENKGDEPETPAKVDKPAMDSAIKSAVAEATKRAAAARQAEKDVRPYIGDLAIAMDSADDIYRMALESADVDLTGVPPAAFPAMLKLIPVPGSAKPRIAMDADADSDFNKRFPQAARIKKL